MLHRDSKPYKSNEFIRLISDVYNDLQNIKPVFRMLRAKILQENLESQVAQQKCNHEEEEGDAVIINEDKIIAELQIENKQIMHKESCEVDRMNEALETKYGEESNLSCETVEIYPPYKSPILNQLPQLEKHNGASLIYNYLNVARYDKDEFVSNNHKINGIIHNKSIIENEQAKLDDCEIVNETNKYSNIMCGEEQQSEAYAFSTMCESQSVDNKIIVEKLAIKENSGLNMLPIEKNILCEHELSNIDRWIGSPHNKEIEDVVKPAENSLFTRKRLSRSERRGTILH